MQYPLEAKEGLIQMLIGEKAEERGNDEDVGEIFLVEVNCNYFARPFFLFLWSAVDVGR